MLNPQLANTIELSQLDRYLTNDSWWMTQKLDGERLMILINDGKVTGIGRSGQRAIPPPIVRQLFKDWPGQWIFDGELVGPMNRKVYWVFDVPLALGKIDLNTPYRERVVALDIVPESPSVKRIPIARTTEEKALLTRRCLMSHAEGMILNAVDGPYVPSLNKKRSPYLLKAKFTTTAEVIVAEVGREGKRSIGITVYDGHRLVPYPEGVGSVKVTERVLDQLEVGDVVEVKYLYMTPTKHLLYQPSFLRKRPDRTPESCQMDQMKVGNKEVLV